MRKVLQSVLVTSVILLVSACSQVVFPEAKRSLTLPNGVVLTEAEAARLDALAPAARAIVARSTRAADSSVDSEAVNAGFKELLKNEFGDDWKKYVVVTVESKTANLETQEIVAEESGVFVDPETMEPVATNLVAGEARGATHERDTVMGFGYFMIARHEYWTWWWGFSNNAGTRFAISVNGETIGLKADYLYARVSDKAGTSTDSTAYGYEAFVEGDFKYAAFYSKSSCKTNHQARLATQDANGQAVNLDSGYITYSW